MKETQPISRITLCIAAQVAAMWCAGCAWYGYGDTRKEEVTQKLTEQGLRSEAEGDLSQATKSLAKAAEVDRADVAARLELARLHRKTGRKEEAIQTLREVVSLTPDDTRAWLELGELYYERRSYVEANQCFNEALKLDPAMISALMYLAELEEIRESDDLALEYYYRVLSLDDDYIPAMLRIARIQIRQNQSVRAALILRTVCYCRGATQRQISEARWLLGLAYGDQQRWKDAVESLRIAMEIHQNPGADELYYLAYAEYRAGEFFEASQTADRLLKLDPQYRPASVLQQRLAAGPPEMPLGVSQVAHRKAAEPMPPPGWAKTVGTARIASQTTVR